MFSSKPSTLGFAGSAIKSYDTLTLACLSKTMHAYLWQVIAPVTIVREGNGGLRFLHRLAVHAKMRVTKSHRMQKHGVEILWVKIWRNNCKTKRTGASSPKYDFSGLRPLFARDCQLLRVHCLKIKIGDETWDHCGGGKHATWTRSIRVAPQLVPHVCSKHDLIAPQEYTLVPLFVIRYIHFLWSRSRFGLYLAPTLPPAKSFLKDKLKLVVLCPMWIEDGSTPIRGLGALCDEIKGSAGDIPASI